VRGWDVETGANVVVRVSPLRLTDRNLSRKTWLRCPSRALGH
jgi:hypothetical protein